MKNPLVRRPGSRSRGFSLIVTLSLMILLSVVAIGLLSISSISLRTSQGESGQLAARANARAALVMAIGELQKYAGDDRRITMAADQLPAGDGSQSAAAEGRAFWTGVYQAWEPDPSPLVVQWPARPEPDDQFLGWLVSPPGLANVSDAKGSGGTDEPIRLVGPGSAGTEPQRWVEVGKVPVREGGNLRGHMAWWVGDQGLKSSISAERTPPPTLAGDARHSVQAAATWDFRTMGSESARPFEDADAFDPMLRALTSTGQTEHLADTSAHEAAKELFHDLAVATSGLLTNVRRGGFRKDLSMHLENSVTVAHRNNLARETLYQVPTQNGAAGGREHGINMEELAAYYKLPTQLQSGSGSFTTGGGSLSAATPTLRFQTSPDACRNDYYHFFKQPVPIAYDTFLSLESELVAGATARYNLRLVVDPVVIMWNPLDVPVMIPANSVPSIKYWTSPFTVKVDVTGTAGTVTRRCHLHASLTTGDHNFMSLDLSVQNTPLVFRPGEVMMISQTSKLRRDGTDHRVSGGPGFSFQNGFSVPLRHGESRDTAVQLTVNRGDTLKVSLEPAPFVNARNGGPHRFPGYGGHSRWYSLMHNEMYLGRDRTSSGQSLPIGGAYIDWDLSRIRLTRNDSLRTSGTSGNKPDGQRLLATQLADFVNFGAPVTMVPEEINVVKKPLALLSFRAKTEYGVAGNSRGTSWLPRFNPKVFLQDFYKFDGEERDISPFEVHVLRLNNLRDYGLLEQNNGRAYFGAAWSLGDGGQTALITHSVPREPIISLGAFQHSMANGFLFQQPKETPGDGYGTLNTRDPLHPQISHPIGNSLAPAVLAPEQTHRIMSDGSGRPLADHSYLANRALWDDWFLSSIAPMTNTTSLAGVSQRLLAQGFFDGTRQLPNRRYLPDTGGLTSSEIIGKLFAGNLPRPDAKDLIASLLRVEGLFNINSTSVEAWKSVLSGLREATIATQNEQGVHQVTADDSGATPVAGLLTPQDQIVGDDVFQEPAPWVGRRLLDDEQIERLAQAIVREIRRSGPFLSLADFINRRPGTDKELAIAGVIERALRDEDAGTNEVFHEEADATVSSTVAGRFRFPEAEQGLKSHGIPGIVKQADILTPIAPYIAVRSDSFIIRAYGEAVNPAGRVTGRAWCEAVVERDREFVDGSENAETDVESLTSEMNKRFGRRFVTRSFRWLRPDEV